MESDEEEDVFDKLIDPTEETDVSQFNASKIDKLSKEKGTCPVTSVFRTNRIQHRQARPR